MAADNNRVITPGDVTGHILGSLHGAEVEVRVGDVGAMEVEASWDGKLKSCEEAPNTIFLSSFPVKRLSVSFEDPVSYDASRNDM
jgi:hypothetical protein